MLLGLRRIVGHTVPEVLGRAREPVVIAGAVVAQLHVRIERAEQPGSVADDALFHELAAVLPNVHQIGDCVAPRKLDHAIYEGELAGRELWSRDERTLWDGELDRWEDPVTV